jgi:cytochrome c
VPGKIILFVVLMVGTILFATLGAAGESGGGPRLNDGDKSSDTTTGRAAFEKRCTGCHALDKEKVGPRLAGVVGRKAGAISTYPYSDAVKKSGVVWSEAVLDKWLADPEAVIPDTDMTFRLTNRDERAAIIAFLKESGK